MTSVRTATLVGSAALALWSSLAVLTTATGGAPPFQMVGLTFGLAALIGIAVQMVKGLNPLDRLRQPVGTWLLSVGGLFGYHALYFLALKAAPAIEANLINYLWPLLIVLGSGLLPGHHLTARAVLGAVMGFVGAALLMGGAQFDPVFWKGYLAAAACAFVWAGYSVGNRLFAQVPSDAVTGFCAVTALLAFGLHFGFESWVAPSFSEWLALAAMGLGPVGAAFFVWDYGMKHGDVRTLGTLAYATPLASTLWLWVFGKGQLTLTVLAATILIVGGAAVGSGLKLKGLKALGASCPDGG
jgi:drug/metabolite transporter (DMT)-like permease